MSDKGHLPQTVTLVTANKLCACQHVCQKLVTLLQQLLISGTRAAAVYFVFVMSGSGRFCGNIHATVWLILAHAFAEPQETLSAYYKDSEMLCLGA